MERVRKEIFIEAPTSKVFEYMLDPAHLPEIWPSLIEVSNVHTEPDGSSEYDWTYKMAGVKFHGHTRTVEAERNRLHIVKARGGIPHSIRWEFRPHGQGTDFSSEVEYEIPGALLGRLAAPFVRRLNEREAELTVRNLKERMEEGASDTARGT